MGAKVAEDSFFQRVKSKANIIGGSIGPSILTNRNMDNCELNTCFDGLIGVYGCHNEGDCKLFVNDLPGISNELLSSITDSERGTYQEVFRKALTGAIRSLKNDVLDILRKERHSLKFGASVYETEQARVLRPLETEVIPSGSVGFILTTDTSRYVTAQLRSISLYPTASIEVKAVIYDLETNEKLDESEPVTLFPNQISTVQLDYSIDSSETRGVLVALESVDEVPFSLARLKCNRFRESACKSRDSLCDCVCGNGETGLKKVLHQLDLDDVQEFAVYPVAFDEIQDREGFQDIDGFVCGGVSVVCSIEQFLCENADRLKDALVYKVGSNLLTEKLGSFRINVFASTNLEFTEQTRNELMFEYKSALKKTVPALPLDGVSLCWQCLNEDSAYYESLV